MRKVITAAIFATTITVSGAASAANIVETAQKAGTFGTLIAAAKAAGLAGALSNGKNLTVFAPTDAAFDKLLSLSLHSSCEWSAIALVAIIWILEAATYIR